LDIPPPWIGPPRARQLALPLLASYQALLATPLLGEATLRSGPAFVRGLIRFASGPRATWDEQQLDVYARPLMEPARARASCACYRTFLTRELPELVRERGSKRAAELRVPALLLMGERSAIDRTLDPQPAGQLHVRRIPGAGHFLPEEAPHAVLDAAEEWFAG
ncbi:MAG TPA: hypothetical protein VKV16_07675, partial [Solirubrobacteraceae bacterium]|nr:hypothetical protein [Solirubrobacteraceae bacterium]